MSTEVITSQAHVVVVHPAVIVDPELGVIAACGNHIVATRLAHLWDRYGITDIPNTPASLSDEESQ